MTPEHFAVIYQACDVATAPAGNNYSAADWWRSLLMFDYMTGWRIGFVVGNKEAVFPTGTGIHIAQLEARRHRDA